MFTALTIAGSDSSGGAGIQADIKTLSAVGVYGMTAVTAVTAQNTLGVQSVFPVPPEILAAQIDSVCRDIPPDAVKIGMIPDVQCARIIAGKIRAYSLRNIVIDTVFRSSGGAVLQTQEAVLYAQKELYPLASVITPNIPEAELLSGKKITTEEECRAAAECLAEKFGCPVLVTGGHSGGGTSDDFLYDLHRFHRFPGARISNPDTHGTGCTLSSAVAGYLAKGFPLEEAVLNAKRFVTGAIADRLKLGHGRGPLNHMYASYPSNQGEKQ